MKTIEEAMIFVKQLIECNDNAGCGRCNDLRIAVRIIEEHLASRGSRTLSAAPSDEDVCARIHEMVGQEATALQLKYKTRLKGKHWAELLNHIFDITHKRGIAG